MVEKERTETGRGVKALKVIAITIGVLAVIFAAGALACNYLS